MQNNSATGKAAIGLDANIAAALGYPIGILGLINFIIEKENQFVKFHGLQSVLYSVGVSVVFIFLWVVLVVIGVMLAMMVGELAILIWLFNILLFLAFFVVMFGGLIFAAYKSYQGEMFKLPIVGNMAEKIINK